MRLADDELRISLVRVVFFLMIRRHRRSTLFPYTTLFRSDLFARLAGFELTLPALSERLEDLGVLVSGILQSTANERVDRKSTRLNSSHLVISYAVFCLKKKKPPIHAKEAPMLLLKANHRQ